MNLNKNFLKIIFLCLFWNISLSNQSQNSYNKNNKRKNEDSVSEYKPMKVLIDTSIIEKNLYGVSLVPNEDVILALSNCSEIISKLLSINNTNTKKNSIYFNFNENQYPVINNSKLVVNGILNNSDYDLIIIANLTFNIKKTNITILCRDNQTNRPTLGILSLADLTPFTGIDYLKTINFQYIIFHYLIHLLGFSYNNFNFFYKNKEKINQTLKTNIIDTPKVLEIAKKYFNCSNITGIPIENLKRTNDLEFCTEVHWDARLLLGDIMNSYNYNYKSDQVISEFTLALLEDSGWYRVSNYYTGGLMRFGKHKGCNFFYNKCSSEFKNEFGESETNTNNFGSCSSGRQSRTFSYLSVDEVDNCIINDFSIDKNDNPLIGHCKYKIDYDYTYDNYYFFSNERKEVSSVLFENLSDNSFCVLVSIKPSKTSTYNNLLDKIQPICYQMFCSDTTLTIKIKDQYIACPREGGKVNITGGFTGNIYCPDYNLICASTILCNDMFDCIMNNSYIKESSYIYDYEIKTSQIKSELINDPILKGYEDTDYGKCRKNCSQCYENGTCIECRDNYYLVGTFFGENRSKIKCLKINISSGYFIYEDIYYSCLSNCDICTNDTLCTKCKSGFYFIGENRTYCDTGKNLNKYYTNDNGISYYPCDTHFNNCDLCTSQDVCTKCKDNYYFIGENKDKCESLPDKTNYFTEDGGISYLLCSNYLPNCQSCNTRNYCTKCAQNYYMIGDNRTICLNNVINNFSEYYIEDSKGPVYYPCDSHFDNCLTCENKETCTQCKNGFIFLRGERKECFTFEKDKTYIEDGKYYPCFDAFPYCDKCSGKSLCYECFENYYFTLDENDKKICDDISINKYYERNDGVYILCSKAINNCDECQNENICKNCIRNYYFLGNYRDNCRNDLDLRKYYSEDNNISYFPCNEAMPQCDFCNNKTVCEKCNDNYYLYKENKNNCIELDDIEKYYQKGNSYYPCNEAIPNCFKCSNEENCYECENNLKLILGQQNICYEEYILSGNNSLIRKNDTFYMKCSEAINHCDICKNDNNEIICTKCEKDYIFLNENKTQCIDISDLTPSDEYIKINDTNYYSCGYKGVKNCKKCKNLTSCDLCLNDYAFVDLNYSFCHNKSEMQRGFYHDFNEFMYFHCIKNCDICINGKECIQCKTNFSSFKDNSYCGICELNISYIYNNNLTEDLIYELVKEYFKQNENSFSMVNLFLNADNNSYNNFSVFILRASECTKLIFDQMEFMEFNLDELNSLINSKIKGEFIFELINYNYKIVLELYLINPEGIVKMNLSEICPECFLQNYLKIKNNFRYEINNRLSQILFDEIIENDFNIFDKEESVFNDICQNFNLKNIDIPLNERRKLFYLGDNSKEILCNNINCDIKNIFLSNTTSFCDCKVDTDFNYLFTIEEQNNSEDYNNFIEQKKSINSFLLFKCAKETFNSKNISKNIGFYISLVLFIIQLVLLILYITLKNFKNSKPKKKLKANPPKLGTVESFSISEDLEENNEKDKGDFEKKIQKKEFQSFHEKKNFGENIIDDDDLDGGDDNQNIQDKDLDSARAREIENEIIDTGGEINEENLKIQENNYKMNRNMEKTGKIALNKEISKTKNKNKLKFLEENSFGGDEGINQEEKKNSKYRNDKLYRTKKLYSIGSKESLNSSDINDIQNDMYQKTEYVKFTDAIKQKEISFWGYYFKLIQLKQPLINLFSPIKCLKLEDSNIPTLVKIMRIIFMLSLNIFFNIFHLDQKYFRKKFEYFNNKYNIIYYPLEKNISSSEIFGYAMTHSILSGFISFIICLFIQSVINIFIFNIRKKINVITSKKIGKKSINENEKVHEIFLLLKGAKKCYIIFFSICLGVMVVIFYLLINYNEVYHGGILDLIAGFLWTFIFLQIIPFIYSLIFALIRYQGIKRKNKKMYSFSQIIFF